MVIKFLIDNISKNNLLCEWGFAVYIEYEDHKLLLDTGASGKFTENAAAMGIDLGEIEFGVLSHAHYDHSDGLQDFFEKNDKAKFYIRDGAGENCYSREETPPKYIGIRRGFLEMFRDRIIYVKGDYELMPGVALIPHKTPDLELAGKKAGMYTLQNGVWKPDDFFHEQSLVFDTEKGLVIFNSCSHSGADNIITEVADTYPGRKIYALIGGLHLFASTDEDVRGLARRIRETGIEKVYTGHCTGEKAMAILKEELGSHVEQIYTGLEIDFSR